MGKLKILMIGGYGPSHLRFGGGQLIAYNLFRSLISRGIDVDYLAIDSENDSLLHSYAGIIHFSSSNIIEQINGLMRLDLAKYDLIHIHSANELRGFLIGAIIIKIIRPRTKIVLSVHSPEIYSVPRSSIELLNLILSHLANQVYSLSEYSQRSISKQFFIPINKVKVTYTGVDDKFIAHTKKTEHPMNSTCRLLLVGRIGDKHEQKGLDTMIQSLAIIRKEVDAKLVVVGPGNSAKYNHLIDQLGLKESIQFLGVIRSEALIHEYLRSDIFVLPSRRESFGLVLAEAMSLGLPVVSTNIGAIPEVVQNNVTGILMPPDDPRSFAKSVIDLLKSSEQRKELGNNGITRVKEHYTLDNMADKVIKYYKEIL